MNNVHFTTSSSNVASPKLTAIAPRADILEGAEGFLVVLDMPGVPTEGVRVETARGELLVEGTPAQGAAGGTITYRRAFALPRTVDPSAIRADLKDGVLSVHLPRSSASQPRRIEVTSA